MLLLCSCCYTAVLLYCFAVVLLLCYCCVITVFLFIFLLQLYYFFAVSMLCYSYVAVVLLLCYCCVTALLTLCYCFSFHIFVATVLPFCCANVVLHLCYCCVLVVLLLFHHCFAAVLLLRYLAVLLCHCCFTALEKLGTLKLQNRIYKFKKCLKILFLKRLRLFVPLISETWVVRKCSLILQPEVKMLLVKNTGMHAKRPNIFSDFSRIKKKSKYHPKIRNSKSCLINLYGGVYQVYQAMV